MSQAGLKSVVVGSPALSRRRATFPRVKISRHAGVSAAIPVALVLLWQLCSSFDLIDAAIMPSPIECAIAWKRWIIGAVGGRSLDNYNGTWLPSAWYSLQRVIEGFGIACLIGIPTGILIGAIKSAAVLDPTIQLLRPVPITAWLPFSIALFGIDNKSALFLIALGAFYPIVVSAAQGARETNVILIRAANMLGASRWTLLSRVVVPSAMPTIFVGLRLGVGAAWTAVVIAEMVSVKSGLGYVLWDAYYLGRMDIVIADMISIGLLGFLSDMIVIALRERLIKWQR